VLKREEIYDGPHLASAPDLILIPADPRDIFFGLADFGSRQTVDTVYRYSGMHRDRGMLLMMGPQVRPGARVVGAAIKDVAPTVLHAMGVPIPSDMDGRPLLELLVPEVSALAPQYVESQESAREYELIYTAQEENEIAQRLRDLGYLG
jgi:predicted AlkP superfamily phosphohydrolase/phosphomutase